MRNSKLLVFVLCASVFASGLLVGYALSKKRFHDCMTSMDELTYHQQIMILGYKKLVIESIDQDQVENLKAKAEAHLRTDGRQYPGWEQYLRKRYPKHDLFKKS